MKLPKYMPALDGLRAVAIMLVLLTHAAGGWGMIASTFHNVNGEATLALPVWLSKIAESATHGVTLFFVVSAFTLTIRSADDRGGLGAYALRRIARVGPGYWLACLAYPLAIGLGPRWYAPDGISATDLIIAAVFGSAWQGGPALAVVPGGWSVSCEVAFYIALPLVIRLIDGRIWRAVLLTGLALLIAQVRARGAISISQYNYAFYNNPIEQAPAFLLGVTAALIATQMRIPKISGLVGPILVFAIVALPFSPIHRWYVMPHLIFAFLCSGAVVLAALHPPAFLANRAMNEIGGVSYSMYLVQFALLAPCLHSAEQIAPGGDWQTLAVYYLLLATTTFFVARVTYRVIELPAIQWANRVSSKRRAFRAAIREPDTV